jgi:chorismate synthase
MGNTIGKSFRLTSFGESHGRCVGVVVDGCPAGLAIIKEDLQKELDRRKPDQSIITSRRKELDKLEILSGIFNGYTTGAPICMLIWNVDVDSSGYEKRKWTPRPGHADWTAHIRYGGYNDYRGGGRFSGRITAGFVMGGALAKRLLKETQGIEVIAHTKEIGGIKAREVSVEEIKTNSEKNPVRCADPDAADKMIQMIKEVGSENDSLGGVVECYAIHVPPGIGQPVFNTLEGDLAKALFAIPAIKAVEFGAGTEFARMRGSESNDLFKVIDGKIVTETNQAGGILGGINTGMPIKCMVTLKPTPSIGKPQQTVNILQMEETTIEIHGRHDTCIVPRAIPVIEGMVAVILTDHLLQSGHIPQVLARDER